MIEIKLRESKRQKVFISESNILYNNWLTGFRTSPARYEKAGTLICEGVINSELRNCMDTKINENSYLIGGLVLPIQTDINGVGKAVEYRANEFK